MKCQNAFFEFKVTKNRVSKYAQLFEAGPFSYFRVRCAEVNNSRVNTAGIQIIFSNSKGTKSPLLRFYNLPAENKNDEIWKSVIGEEGANLLSLPHQLY